MSFLKTKRRYSLKWEMLFLSIVSLCAAGITYFLLADVLFIHLLSRIDTESYNLRAEQKYASELQEYISENSLCIEDMEEIDLWSMEKDYVIFKLYVHDVPVYDSIYGVLSEGVPGSENQEMENSSMYQLDFTDGKAQAVFFCFDELKLYDHADKIALVLSFVVFFLILYIGIHKKIKYLILIKRELDGLTEALDKPVSVLGNDEITSVAQSINSLRVSVMDKIEKEKLAYQTNSELITALSHDVRTPLTSLIQYLELAGKKAQGNSELEKYLSISTAKAYALTDLTDELFEYFLLDSSRYEAALELVRGNELIVQMLEEHLLDMEIQGITIQREVDDITSSLYVNVKLVYRLFNNIFSNIHKYADLSKGLFVSYNIKENQLMIRMKNYKRIEAAKVTSTKIGLKNCAAIMEIHNGKLETENKEDSFCISLYFPIVSE